MILTIDPGKKSCGWAVFSNDMLEDCGLWRKAEKPYGYWKHIDRVVLELPQVYERRKSKGDPNDLVDIAAVGGWLAGNMAPNAHLDAINPHEWKGNVDPEIMLGRIIDRLIYEREQTILASVPCPASLRHNVIDAIGIGLHVVGRL